MKRLVLLTLSAVLSYSSLSQYVVFEKEGYYGITDPSGEVVVPATHETLGWSDHTEQVHADVIGFRRDEKWGLISVKNKVLAEAQFYSIEPMVPHFYKASIKGKFSNRLFKGIIDSKGAIKVSFNYFDIEPLGSNWLVSDYIEGETRQGVVSFENKLIIPHAYMSIKERGNMLFAQSADGRIDLYSKAGKPIETGLDSIRQISEGWIGFKNGYAGHFNRNGHLTYPYRFKDFVLRHDTLATVAFPQWDIYQNEKKRRTIQGDSITQYVQGKLLVYKNGVPDLIRLSDTLVYTDQGRNDLVLQQNTFSGKWSMKDRNSDTVLLSQKDSIRIVGHSILYLEKNKWKIYPVEALDRPLKFDEIHQGMNGQWMVKKSGFWGLISKNGSAITNCKYDSIRVSDNQYLVYYLGKWGSMNDSGQWLIKPSFDTVYTLGNLLIGGRGQAYTIAQKSRLLHKTVHRPIALFNDLVIGRSDSGYTFWNRTEDYTDFTSYDSIYQVGEFVVLHNEHAPVGLLNARGHAIVTSKEGYDQFKCAGQGYVGARKNGRWGFVDAKGRLRISNRYDDVGSFSDGVAPVKLKGRWGCIDKDEKLVIQPYYNYISTFQKRVAIVQQEGKFGLLSQTGEMLVKVSMKSIQRLRSGNYIVQNSHGKLGLINNMGQFIIRPNFAQLISHEHSLLVSNGEKWGLLSYNGEVIFNIAYDQIKVFENITAIKI